MEEESILSGCVHLSPHTHPGDTRGQPVRKWKELNRQVSAEGSEWLLALLTNS